MMAPDTLPSWPRLLSADLASRYVGVSKTTFLKGVGKVWPKPKRIGKRRVWDRMSLDEAADQIPSEGASVADPFMEALHG